MTTPSPVDADRELWAVLVALEPLDDRKWRYLDLTRRTFDADGLLAEPWSSGERVLVEVAASLWDTGLVDLGYIACAIGGRHFQAIIDALAVRAGHSFTSQPDSAGTRIAAHSRRERERPTRQPDRARALRRDPAPPPHRRGRDGIER
jgi:hypothetical protein